MSRLWRRLLCLVSLHTGIIDYDDVSVYFQCSHCSKRERAKARP